MYYANIHNPNHKHNHIHDHDHMILKRNFSSIVTIVTARTRIDSLMQTSLESNQIHHLDPLVSNGCRTDR